MLMVLLVTTETDVNTFSLLRRLSETAVDHSSLPSHPTDNTAASSREAGFVIKVGSSAMVAKDATWALREIKLLTTEMRWEDSGESTISSEEVAELKPLERVPELTQLCPNRVSRVCPSLDSPVMLNVSRGNAANARPS